MANPKKNRPGRKKKLSKRIAKVIKAGGWRLQIAVFLANFFLLLLGSMDVVFTAGADYLPLGIVASISTLLDLWFFLTFIKDPKRFWIAVALGEVLGELVGTWLGHQWG